MKNKRNILKIKGLLLLPVLIIFYQQCSNIKLTQTLAEPSSNQMSGKLCFPHDREQYSEYSLSDFYILNLTTRKYKNSNQADSNMNGILDSLETAETLKSQSSLYISELDTDEDGLPDFIETLKGLNPTQKDLDLDGFDLDGVTNKRELQQGTDPDYSSENPEVIYQTYEDFDTSDCGEGQPAYSFNISQIPVSNTETYTDTINTNPRTSLSHAENENVFLILARMTPLNAQNETFYLTKIFKHSGLESLSMSLKPSDFFILGSETQDSDSIDSGTPKYFTKVSLGLKHSCALTSNGKIYCWGNNSYGQLGDETFLPRYLPAQNKLPSEAKLISLGEHHSCALTVSEEVYCWGYNYYGQLGNGNTLNSAIPTKVNLLGSAKSISTGSNHTCAEVKKPDLTSTIQCWGRNHNNQLGDGTTIDKTLPTEILAKFENNTPLPIQYPLKSLSSGGDHNCIVDNQTNRTLSFCWGKTKGIFEPRPKMIPNPLTLGTYSFRGYFYQLITNGDIIYGLTPNPALYTTPSGNSALCFSYDYSSQFNHAVNLFQRGCGALSENGDSFTVQISRVHKISLGGNSRTCAIHERALTTGLNPTYLKKLDCWGASWDPNDEFIDTTPQTVSEIKEPLDVSLSKDHACAIDKDRVLWCWGKNNYGQLGSGDLENILEPTKVKF